MPEGKSYHSWESFTCPAFIDSVLLLPTLLFMIRIWYFINHWKVKPWIKSIYDLQKISTYFLMILNVDLLLSRSIKEIQWSKRSKTSLSDRDLHAKTYYINWRHCFVYIRFRCILLLCWITDVRNIINIFIIS